jgi:hypothetical protein
MKRKPTRRDLLIVIGRLHRLIGLATCVDHDRNQNRSAQLRKALSIAHGLCIDARSYDPSTEGRSPWAENDDDDARRIEEST